MIPAEDLPLSDGRVALRLCAERDIPEMLIAYEDDRHLHERLGEARPPSGADLGRASEEAAQKLEAGVRAQLTITEAASDVCIGVVTISEIDWEHARGEIQVWVAPALRGRGYARAALRLAAAWAFETWGIARLTALVEPDNVMMHRAAAAAGFRHEGTFNSYRPARRGRRDGRRIDLDVLALIPTDLEENGGEA